MHTSFFESQIFGVLVGALIAGVSAALLEAGRRRSERRRDARDLRRQTHADAISALYLARDTLIRLFVVTGNPPELPRDPKGRERIISRYERDRTDAFQSYDAAGRRLGEMIHLTEAFGAPGVNSALREFGHVTSWYVGEYLHTAPEDCNVPFKDLEDLMEYLIAAACEEARRDSDAGHRAVRPQVPHRDGRPTWLGRLEEVAQATPARTESPRDAAAD